MGAVPGELLPTQDEGRFGFHIDNALEISYNHTHPMERNRYRGEDPRERVAAALTTLEQGIDG
ncbi:MAG TPA: hypothetical protein VNL71_11285, partial [Chloroflexota bacterium]|nr:hypothetical protein [Chloroflexota bacterium]